MAGFYYIRMKYDGKQVGTPAKAKAVSEAVEKKLNLAYDWIKFEPNTWLIFTSKNAEVWYARLSPYVKPDGILFISKLDVEDRQGWMLQSFWAWIKKNTERQQSLRNEASGEST